MIPQRVTGGGRSHRAPVLKTSLIHGDVPCAAERKNASALLVSRALQQNVNLQATHRRNFEKGDLKWKNAKFVPVKSVGMKLK